MSFFPQRLRSKSVSAGPHECDLSQSCPNLLDLDDDLAGTASAVSSRSTARTPGPELVSLASSPKGQKSKKCKSLFLLPVKFRRAKERKAQTQALKLPVYPINSSQNTSMMMVPLQDSLGPPTNVRPKHTRPTGLGLGLGGLFGGNLKSPRGKLRRGSDSCLPSPSSGIKHVNSILTTVVEHLNSEEDCSDLDSNYLSSPSYSRQLRRGSDSCILSPSRDNMKQGCLLPVCTDIEHSSNVKEEDCSNDFDGRQSCPDLLKSSVRFADNDPPVSAPPICIVVSSSGDERGRNLLKADPYKKFLGKSLEQVWLINNIA